MLLYMVCMSLSWSKATNDKNIGGVVDNMQLPWVMKDNFLRYQRFGLDL